MALFAGTVSAAASRPGPAFKAEIAGSRSRRALFRIARIGTTHLGSRVIVAAAIAILVSHQGVRAQRKAPAHPDLQGMWNGATLVVDTTNFRPEVHNLDSGERLHVVERFTRIDRRTLRYRVTVDDPETWATAWTAEWPFRT